MPVFHVTPQSFPNELRRKLDKDVRNIQRAALTTAMRVQAEAIAITNREGLVDQGIYKRAFRVVRTFKGAELRNDAPHAATIEYGRRPGATPPPLGPILGWVRRKLNVKPGEAFGVALAIQKSIGRRGLPPHGIFRRARRRAALWYAEAAADAWRRG